jgi:hypothetical protein
MTTYEWAWAEGTSVTYSCRHTRSKKKTQIGCFRKGAEIPIACEERKAMIEAELRNQCVAKPGTTTLGQHFGA